MNRVNLLCVVTIGCFLIVPSLTLPTNNEAASEIESMDESMKPIPNTKNEKDNEVNSDLGGDSKIIEDTEKIGDTEIVGNPEIDNEGNTDVAKPIDVEGGSTGFITRIGFDGEFECHKIVCPPETTTCFFTKKMHKDGKNSDVLYTCKALNGTVLLNRTTVEPVEEFNTFDDFGFSQVFQDMESKMRKFMADMFSHSFFSGDDDDDDQE